MQRRLKSHSNGREATEKGCQMSGAETLRIDQQYLKAPALQELKQRAPIALGRFQGDGRDPARGSPVRQALSVDPVRGTAVDRLGIATWEHRHKMRFGPHVEAHRTAT
jgi:hypothetical protein